jgi:hypothetical protein
VSDRSNYSNEDRGFTEGLSVPAEHDYAKVAEYSGRRVLVAGLKDLISFGSENGHKQGIAGSTWGHLVRQYAINQLEGNPISAIHPSDLVPDFPLVFLRTPSKNDIQTMHGKYPPFTKKVDELVVETLKPYICLIEQRANILSMDEAIASVVQRMGPKKFGRTALSFLRHYTEVTLGESF